MNMNRIFLKLKILNSKGLVLNPGMNHYISSFIYNLVNDNDLHDSTKMKHFTFSDIFFDTYDFKKGKINVSGDSATLVISSKDSKFSSKILKSSLDKNKIHRIGKMFFNIINVDFDNTKVEDDNLFYCKAVSPICLTKKGDRYEQYLSPKDDEYQMYLTRHLERRLGYKPKNFSFMVDGERPIKSKMINIKGTKIRGYKYNFFIKCDSETFNELYYSGFGGKCSQGFGMFNVLKSDKVK